MKTNGVRIMSMTTHSEYSAPLEEFNVDTKMRDVEIFHVSPDRILAKGKRFGRMWLLRGLSPEKRRDCGLQRQLREEFDRRYTCLEPDMPLTVGIEDIDGLGPCIVEEWREDYNRRSPVEEKSESCSLKHILSTRDAVILIIAFIATAGALVSGFYINRLTALSETAMADLEALRIANRQGEERMFMLADSLDKVMRVSLIPEESVDRREIMEEDKEERMVKALYRARVKDFGKELARYDRCVMPEVTDNLPVFYDSICALYRCMIDMGRDIDPYGRFPQLPEDYRIRLTGQLYGCYLGSIHDYMRVWIPKAREAHEKKKENDPERRTD
ncbi:MAG: hypothetical protein K2K23_07190 [Muribaculaceae bacterium]|nr:hypothetical protein [Muribaculaceae bacterium]